jgi:L-lactate dehydrogenase complex protein LldG
VSGARERVLASIRRSLRRTGPVTESVAEALAHRLAAHPANPRPAFDEPPLERFAAKVQAAGGLLTRVADLRDVSPVVEAHLERFGLPFELVAAPDPALEGIVWSNRFAVERRAAGGADQTSVTGAFAGVGETGTLMLLSGPQSPTTLNFLPEDHLAVLRASRVVPHLEDAWALLRASSSSMPRTVNLITGPSKTGDVEQVIQEGAHGPRRLHVILVENL